MTEFDQVEQVLSTELARVGARARPPVDAWERFASRLDSRSPMPIPTTFPEESQPTSDAWTEASDRAAPTADATSNEQKWQVRRRWPVLVTAAASIAVMVAGLSLMGVVGDDPDSRSRSGPVIELRGAEGNPNAVEAFSAVSAMFEAFNSGDLYGWIGARAKPQTEVDIDALQHHLSAMAAGARYDVRFCAYRGYGEFETKGHPGYGPVEGHLFECETTMTDAFTTAAGIDVAESFRIIVAQGRVVDASSDSDTGSSRLRDSFANSFVSWLRREHPHFLESLDGWPRGSYPPLEDIPEALELLDDFVAADDRWPLRND